jgi:hypothetical protein
VTFRGSAELSVRRTRRGAFLHEGYRARVTGVKGRDVFFDSSVYSESSI